MLSLKSYAPWLLMLVLTLSTMMGCTLFDRNRFQVVGNMHSKRAWHTATPLKNGMTLIVGGNHDGTGSITSELFDPRHRTFGSVQDIPVLTQHMAVALQDGNVLIIDESGSLLLYHADSNQFETLSGLKIPRRKLTATLLNNGEVLIAGGCTGKVNCNYFISEAEIYNPLHKSVSLVSHLNYPRISHTAFNVNGKIFLIGGLSKDRSDRYLTQSEPNIEVYDPRSKDFKIWDKVNLDFASHLYQLNSTTLLAIGQESMTYYYPLQSKTVSAEFTLKKELTSCKSSWVLQTVNQLLLVSCDPDQQSEQKELWTFNPKTRQAKRLGHFSQPKSQYELSILPNNQLLITGGQGQSNVYLESEVYLNQAEIATIK